MTKSQYIKPTIEIIAHESLLMASNSHAEKWCVDHEGENEQEGDDRGPILDSGSWTGTGGTKTNPFDSDNW